MTGASSTTRATWVAIDVAKASLRCRFELRLSEFDGHLHTHSWLSRMLNSCAER